MPTPAAGPATRWKLSYNRRRAGVLEGLSVIGYPSNVLVIADYSSPHFEERIEKRIDFVLSCGDVDFRILQEIHERFGQPIFAVKGNHDSRGPYPAFVRDVHLRLVQYRNWFIGGFAGVPGNAGGGNYVWDDLSASAQLARFPYVDIFICHAPLLRLTDKDDAAHQGSESLRRYVEEMAPQYVYHGHVHQGMAAMLGPTAVVSVYGAAVFSLTGSPS